MKYEELMNRIENLISVIDRAYDCVAEHGKSGLASIDNVKRVAQDVKIAAEKINEPAAEEVEA